MKHTVAHMPKDEAPDALILASASPRRSDILLEAGYRFRIVAANVEEYDDPQAVPDNLVLHNALLKAQHVAKQFPSALVIGSDTTVCHKHENLGKPANLEHARQLLRRLSGQSHTVHTAVALCCHQTRFEEITHDTSTVYFKPFDDATIERYIEIVNPLDKAGAYGIQEARDMIIDRYDGSYTNIMGLPIEALNELLEKHQLRQRFQ